MTETKGNKCTLCPRQCGADRASGRGICGADDKVRIARVGLHAWEEPCISYGNGSGTVFFSGCSLKCVFCQNYEISSLGKGRDIDPSELSEVFLSVRDMGAVNLNLVNPTHYSDSIIKALEKVNGSLGIPVVYNTGGYDKVDTLKKFEGLVDIYLPDVKYFDSAYSERFSSAPDYFEVASKAVTEMCRQVSYPVLDGEGHMKSGFMVRHLVLPTLFKDSFKVLDFLAENFDKDRLYLSLMRQYFPTHRAKEYRELSRRLTSLEYDKVCDYAARLGIAHGYTQDKSSAMEDYVPSFDY